MRWRSSESRDTCFQLLVSHVTSQIHLFMLMFRGLGAHHSVYNYSETTKVSPACIAGQADDQDLPAFCMYVKHLLPYHNPVKPVPGIYSPVSVCIIGVVTAGTSSVKKRRISELASSQTSVSDSQTSVSL